MNFRLSRSALCCWRRSRPAIQPGNTAQNPHSQKANQGSGHGSQGKEQMGKLRRGLGEQGFNAAHKPEKYGPLRKTVANRGKPHAALRGLGKGQNTSGFTRTIQAVPHKGGPGLGQHDEQEGKRPNNAGCVKNIVGKTGSG